MATPGILTKLTPLRVLVVVNLLALVVVAGLFVLQLASSLQQPKPTHSGWIWPEHGDSLGTLVDAIGVPMEEIGSVTVSYGCEMKKATAEELLASMWRAKSLKPPPYFNLWIPPEDLDYNIESWGKDYLLAYSDWKNERLTPDDLVVIRRKGIKVDGKAIPGGIAVKHQMGGRVAFLEILDHPIANEIEITEYLQSMRTYSDSSNGRDITIVRVKDATAFVGQAVDAMTSKWKGESKPRFVKPGSGSWHGVTTVIKFRETIPPHDAGIESWSFRVLAPDMVELWRWEPD